MGKNNMEKLLPSLCVRVGIQRFTNHDMRTTFITMASQVGLSRFEICKRTGHKRPESLDPYITDDNQTARNKAARFDYSRTTNFASPQGEVVQYNSNCMSTMPAHPLPLTMHAQQLCRGEHLVQHAAIGPLAQEARFTQSVSHVYYTAQPNETPNTSFAVHAFMPPAPAPLHVQPVQNTQPPQQHGLGSSVADILHAHNSGFANLLQVLK